MNKLTVIFDLDGTMIDTAPDLVAATNHALGLQGLAPVDSSIIAPAVAYGARAMIRVAMASHGREPDAGEVEVMTEFFLAYYEENIAVYSRPYPGLIEALDRLRAGGAKLGVCTNKRGALACKLLNTLGLDGYFAAIAGRDRFAFHKPDGRHVLGTIELAGGDQARAVMIGDSSADSNAARDAGVGFIAVGFGYGEKPVETLRPDAIINSFLELGGRLNELFSVVKQ